MTPEKYLQRKTIARTNKLLRLAWLELNAPLKFQFKVQGWKSEIMKLAELVGSGITFEDVRVFAVQVGVNVEEVLSHPFPWAPKPTPRRPPHDCYDYSNI
ncbi:MAG: hypothetical protein HYV33_03380 [Candidatus Kerfeldbacteria bacterium]|nr:hypothetical protein [Candidatus Kerfeldbacteria bacterium]